MTKETVYWVAKCVEGEAPGLYLNTYPLESAWVSREKATRFASKEEAEVRPAWMYRSRTKAVRVVRPRRFPAGEVITLGKRRFKLVEITPAEK